MDVDEENETFLSDLTLVESSSERGTSLSVSKSTNDDHDLSSGMDIEREPEEFADLTKCWSYPAWLGQFPLNRDTAMDYFRFSDFYDRTCNNEQLMQSMRLPNASNIPLSALEELTGVEYTMALRRSAKGTRSESSPQWIVIEKYRRESPERRHLLASYYMIGNQAHPQRGVVYPLASAQLVFEGRLRNATKHLCDSLDKLSALRNKLRSIHQESLKESTLETKGVKLPVQKD